MPDKQMIYEERQEAIFPPSEYTHPVGYVNGKTYKDSPQEIRDVWHVMRRRYGIKAEILRTFNEPDWIIPGQWPVEKFDASLLLHIDAFVEWFISKPTTHYSKGKTIRSDFMEYLGVDSVSKLP